MFRIDSAEVERAGARQRKDMCWRYGIGVREVDGGPGRHDRRPGHELFAPLLNRRVHRPAEACASFGFDSTTTTFRVSGPTAPALGGTPRRPYTEVASGLPRTAVRVTEPATLPTPVA